MSSRTVTSHWARFQRLRRQRRVQNAATLGLVVLGPVLALATFLVLGPFDLGASSSALRAILLVDFVYVLSVAALVLQNVVRAIASRRARSAGSRLHLRLTGAFTVLAIVPAVTVAVFAGLTLNIGLEGWFSERVRQVVGNSLSAAQAYEEEHIEALKEDAAALADFLNAQRRATYFMDSGELRVLLAAGQVQIQRGLKEAFVIDGTGEIRARGERSYLFDFEQPSEAQMAEALEQGYAIIRDLENNEMRALVRLDAFVDRFLYISREVDAEIFQLLDDTQASAMLYSQLESERGRRLFEFGLIYLGFALILVLAAIWMGMWFAERLSRPVGRLTSAAQRVGGGDLDVRVVEEEGDDEIAMLSRYFNQMTRQLKVQRQTLLDNTRQIDRRRRMFDSVLSSVTSGVVGLDAEGKVAFVNKSAESLLEWADDRQDMPLTLAVPEFGLMFENLCDSGKEVSQEEIKVSRSGRLENLLVRMSTRRRDDGSLEGYVVAFDDVTSLVTAQRMAAWGDVARRIAHEIKNPLTPIQLSAERIRRKFASRVGEESDQLEQMTDVIVRQTNDLRRIVDEFSKFARMPEPERRPVDVVELVSGAVLLQEAGQPDVRFVRDICSGPLAAELDATMISQALTNLIKNAGEAIETLMEKSAPDGFVPEIHIDLSVEGRDAIVCIADNGIGLPEDRAKLFEPYVTTRDKGTGLGLPIVKKIIEEHGGQLSLLDAPVFENNAHFGAMAQMRLPLTESAVSSAE
ncbi:sensor histidine kinase NtrY-like [Shimia marina]|uniref:histidine kinase n=1 Tax=Shimia marina TaxID=321267 RepID=A0A0P1ESM1_9RHOB|nr:PAS domain-containing sensor histidine kinase [Shimia marina]CUH53555.1 Sensor histidine kinase YycG [Shimia marina]SFD74385.1 two-component system, NtrC family, nitrogen regulation sensor histidine kinase NtrY [Shimia marina]